MKKGKENKKVSILDTKTKEKEIARKVGSLENKLITFNEFIQYLQKIEGKYSLPLEIEEEINKKVTNFMLPKIKASNIEALIKKYVSLYKGNKEALILSLQDEVKNASEGIVEAIHTRTPLMIEDPLSLEEIEKIIRDYIDRNVDPAEFFTKEEGKIRYLQEKVFNSKHLAIKGGLALLLKNKANFILKYEGASIKADAQKTVQSILEWTENKNIRVLKWISNGKAVIPAKIEIDNNGKTVIVEITPCIHKKWIQVKKPSVDRRKDGFLLNKEKFMLKYLA